MTDFHKKKKYGQNFLTSPAIPSRIAAESGCAGLGVIEIGPGLGILTNELLKVAQKVVAVEIDDELIPLLQQKFESSGLTLVHSDILECDIASLIKANFGNMPVCVCANLPYYVTTPILMKLLEGEYGFKTITVMVQREVADRLTAKKGSTDNSALTVACSYYAEVKRLFTVSAGSFSPPPKVNSAVVRFDIRESPLNVNDKKLLFNVIKAAYGQRRKTLLNSLSALSLDKSVLTPAFDKASLSPTLRAEQLDIHDFIKLTNAIG